MTRFWSVYYQFMMLQVKLIFLWLFYPVIFKLFAISSIIYVLGQPKKWKSWLCSDLTGYIAAALIPVVFFCLSQPVYNEVKFIFQYDYFIRFIKIIFLFCLLEFIVCYSPAYFRKIFKTSESFYPKKSIQILFYIVIFELIFVFLCIHMAHFFSAWFLGEIFKNIIVKTFIHWMPLPLLILCCQGVIQSYILFYKEETDRYHGIWNRLKFIFNFVLVSLFVLELTFFSSLLFMEILYC